MESAHKNARNGPHHFGDRVKAGPVQAELFQKDQSLLDLRRVGLQKISSIHDLLEVLWTKSRLSAITVLGFALWVVFLGEYGHLLSNAEPGPKDLALTAGMLYIYIYI